MIKGVTDAHLGPIWYHSEPSDVPYSTNQFLGWDFFCRFLQQDGSSYLFWQKMHLHINDYNRVIPHYFFNPDSWMDWIEMNESKLAKNFLWECKRLLLGLFSYFSREFRWLRRKRNQNIICERDFLYNTSAKLLSISKALSIWFWT